MTMGAFITERLGAVTNWFSIFTSTSTLVCCALPALLVALGAGTALISLNNVFPQLIWLSEHKIGVFVLAGLMLLLAGLFQWRANRLPCPADPALARACTRQRRVSRSVYVVSCVTFVVGGFFAFIAPLLL